MTTEITVTKTMWVNSSSEQTFGEQLFSEDASIIWMSLFILFLVLTIISVTINAYLACVLRKKSKCKVNEKTGNQCINLVDTNSLCKSLYTRARGNTFSFVQIHVTELMMHESQSP